MNVIFFDREDDTNELNGAEIRDKARLLQVLDGLLDRPPFVGELEGDNGFHLHIGIGKLGHAQYSRLDGEPPYLMALAPNPAQEDVEFLIGNTPTSISNRYCMPFGLVREIADHFLDTGRAHPGFSWEEI
jgi:hypothetical protein